jgi:hypothetical protein
MVSSWVGVRMSWLASYKTKSSRWTSSFDPQRRAGIGKMRSFDPSGSTFDGAMHMQCRMAAKTSAPIGPIFMNI